MMHETFRTLLTDRAHWEFEIFGQLLFDVLLGAILYPWLSKHIRHHLIRDKQEEAKDTGGFVPWRWNWEVTKPTEVGRVYADRNGSARECVAEGVTVGHKDPKSYTATTGQSDVDKKFGDLVEQLFDSFGKPCGQKQIFQYVEPDGTPTGEPDMAKSKVKMDLTHASEIISEAADEALIENAVETSINIARRLSKDVQFNLAAYLKYDFGGSMTGMDDKAWLDCAESILKVVSNR